MKRTISSFRPLGALTDSISVKKPYLYLSTSIALTRATVSCTAGITCSQIPFSGSWLSCHLPALLEPIDQLTEGPEESLYIGIRGRKTKAYADCSLCKLRRNSHGTQYVRGLDFSRRAG